METIFKRRSVRKYTDTAVSDEQLKQIIKAGMAAPSAKNSQEWIFIVLRDPAIYQTFSEVHVNAFAMKTAQAAILVCADLSKEKDPGQGWWIQDCAAAMENMLLEAEHLGIGAVWLGVYPNEERIKTMRPVFDIPDEIEIFCLLSFGYPEFKKTAKDRWDGSRVHNGRWNQ